MADDFRDFVKFDGFAGQAWYHQMIRDKRILRRAREITPERLFKSGEQGVWYDPSDTTTLFQDSAGTTPVTASGQPVGLMLDKSRGLVLGQELVDLSKAVPAGSLWAFSSGAWSVTTPNANYTLSVPVTAIGAFYESTITLGSIVGGPIEVRDGSATGALIATLTTAGAHNIKYRAGSRGLFLRANATGMSVTITGWSIRELPGNHASQPTAASRPLFQDVGGLRYLAFDGVDDFLSTGSINFTGTDKVSVFAGVRKLSDAVTAIVAELSPSVSSSNGSFYLAAPASPGAPSIGFAAKGTSQSTPSATNLAAPVAVVASGQADIATADARLRINGALRGKTSLSLGTGNFGNYPLYIGRRNGTSLPFNGWFYGLAITGRLTTDAETAATERFLAAKSAVVIP